MASLLAPSHLWPAPAQCRQCKRHPGHSRGVTWRSSAVRASAAVAGAHDGSYCPPPNSPFASFVPTKELIQVGHPCLRRAAKPVPEGDIPKPETQKLINDMVQAMRVKAGVGIAAPQVGVGLQIIALEDLESTIAELGAGEAQQQERVPFGLKVLINPKLEKLGTATSCLFEGCLSVQGYRALVQRHLEVSVTALSASGEPVSLRARGFMARILQHEIDHCAGTLYVDRMYTRSFRRVDMLKEPLPEFHPEFGAVPPVGPVVGRGFSNESSSVVAESIGGAKERRGGSRGKR